MRFSLIFLMLFPFFANASILGLLNPDNWNQDYISNELLKLLVKRATRPEKPSYLVYRIDNNEFQSLYTQNMLDALDLRVCQSRDNNPAWIEGIKIPVRYDANGLAIYTVARGALYTLAQRDLSRRGTERLTHHYHSWIINKEKIVQSTNDAERYLDTSFDGYYRDTVVLNPVISGNWVIGISTKGTTDENYGIIDMKTRPKVDTKGATLKFCSAYKVQIVDNTMHKVNIGLSTNETNQGVERRERHIVHNFYAEVYDAETDNKMMKYSWKFTFDDGSVSYSTEKNPSLSVHVGYVQIGQEDFEYPYDIEHARIIKAEVVVNDGAQSNSNVRYY